MKASSQILALAALVGGLALAACGGSSVSPVAATTTSVVGDDGVVTASGYGPAAGTGTGTCTNDCDGTGAGDGYGPGPFDGLCGGACTGPVGPDPADIGAILVVAVQEEYKAEMLYRSVLGTFGPDTAPFALIVQAEVRHVAAIQALFARRELAVPASAWSPSSFAPFADLAAACAGGVAAETEDAAFYTPYLERDDLPQDVRNVFTNLQRASLENHLPAFERCQ
jgi:hypothetical protein